jgi:hypothetical protein
VSGRTSANTTFAPRSANPVAPQTNHHLVPRFDVEHERGELERVRARRHQQGAPDRELALQQLLAAPRERAVARDVAVVDGVADELELVPQQARAVERDPELGHPSYHLWNQSPTE